MKRPEPDTLRAITAPGARPENSPQTRVRIVSRRHFLISAAQAGLAAGFLMSGGRPAEALNRNYKDAMEEVLKGAKPSAELMTLKMPEIAENGNVVSLTLDATAAETDGKRLTGLYIYATDNPWPYVANITLSPDSGMALITTRMRLARSQKVVALAAVEDGSFLMSEAFVKVTIGGCGG